MVIATRYGVFEKLFVRVCVCLYVVVCDIQRNVGGLVGMVELLDVVRIG